ncbi:MAG: sulfite exporter TauE/SafE family protein [Promethearchaeota archaeon]
MLIGIGALVGISMSFIGQTGQGVVIPAVLLITGDVLLAIAISVLNDLVTASAVSVGYVRKRQFHFRKDIFILTVVAIIGSFIGIYILMTTPLGSVFGFVLPLFIICLGLFILKQGFPTSESLKRTALNLTKKVLEKRGDRAAIQKLEARFNEDDVGKNEDEIKGIIPSGSRIFYLLAIGFGLYIGINSGMFGANSGFIITLVLVMLYGYPLKKGVGSALILSIIVCSCTFLLYQLLGFTIKHQFFVDPAITLCLIVGSVPIGIFASASIQKLSPKKMGMGMGTVMMLLGFVSLLFYLI